MAVYFSIELVNTNNGYILVWADDPNSHKHNTFFYDTESLWAYIKEHKIMKYIF